MRRKDLLPYYLRNIIIRGFEEDKDSDKTKDDKSKGSESEEDDEDEDDEDDEGSKNKDKETDNDGLKSALRKERMERKKLARENKALQKFKDDKDGADKSETDKAKDEATKAASKAQKLAAKLKETAIDNAIIKLGSKLKFRDIDDALKLVDRKAIEVEQDDEDPDEVEIDESSVESALKALAKAKPHLIVAEGQEDKSGSKFGGGRKSQKEVDDAELKSKYPALNRSSHTS